MEKIITWRAFDGEEFSSEEECVEYEQRLNRVAKTVLFYKNGERIPCESAEELEEAYRAADMVRIIDTPTWLEDLEFGASWWGIFLPDEPGLYTYDWDNLNWIPVFGSRFEDEFEEDEDDEEENDFDE